MSAPRFIAIGASAGGVESLRRLVGSLPPDLDAAVGIVLHISPSAPSLLPQILGRACLLPVTHARDGEAIESGHIYIAPPDSHLLVSATHFTLDRGAPENFVRPAVDTLFRSVAVAFGARAIGVVLSGSLSDGAAGLEAIKCQGGRAVVQDPLDASHPDMPLSAIKRVKVDCVAPASELAVCILDLMKSGGTQ